MAKKLKPTEHIFLITDHNWGGAVNVVFTTSMNGSIEQQCEIQDLKYHKYKIKTDAQGAVVTINELHYRAIWVLFDTHVFNEGILVHEVTHLVDEMLISRGIRHNLETTEVWAYTQEWFFNKIKSFWDGIDKTELSTDLQQSGKNLSEGNDE